MKSHAAQKFDLLENDNYFTWKYQMEMQLTKKDLWSIVDGSESCPATGPAYQCAWDKCTKLAMAEIILHVSDSQLPHTQKATDAVKMWNTLKEVHESSGWANWMTLLRQFVSLKKEEDLPNYPPAGMQEHINSFNHLDQSLQGIGINLDDTLQMTILLASLPTSYENVITVIESHIETQSVSQLPAIAPAPPITASEPNFDYVMHHLLNEEHKQILDFSQTHGTLNSSKPLPFRGTVSLVAQSHHPPLKNVTCYNCPDLVKGGAITSALALGSIGNEPDFAF
jgi:hypothetical protein